MNDVYGVLTFISCLVLCCTACVNRNERRLNDLIDFEVGNSSMPDKLSSQRIAELEDAIEQYREIIEQKVEAAASLAEYYKLLALEYIDRHMWNLALDNLEEAIAIEPENKVLFWLSGISAARSAQSVVGSVAVSEERYDLAEAYYLRSLSLDNDWEEAHWALAILYLYEMNEPDAAESHIEHLLQLDSTNVQALMLSGHIYAISGQRDLADRRYAEVERITTDSDVREAARRNREQLTSDGPFDTLQLGDIEGNRGESILNAEEFP